MMVTIQNVDARNYLFSQRFILGAVIAWVILTPSRAVSMDRIVLATLALVTTVAPAFAGVAVVPVPEPATMTLFGLGAGGVYLAKRFIGRK